MKRPFFDTKRHRNGPGQHAICLFFRNKIIHRTPVYNARTFLIFGRNFTNPGEKQFFLGEIAHAAPQKKQLPHGSCFPIPGWLSKTRPLVFYPQTSIITPPVTASQR